MSTLLEQIKGWLLLEVTVHDPGQREGLEALNSRGPVLLSVIMGVRPHERGTAHYLISCRPIDLADLFTYLNIGFARH